MRRLSILFVLNVCLVAQAHWTEIPSSHFSLSPPPRKGSPAYKRDFQVLLEWQEKRTDQECSLAQSQQYPSFESLFGSAELLSLREREHVAPFLEKTVKFAERVSNYYKNKHQRPRPFHVNPEIEPCVTKPTGAKAYPSSHAAMSTLAACVLAKIYPERARALITYGNFLSQLRVRVGVHHPSDVKAGQELANKICKELSHRRDFQKELANYR